LFEHQICRIRCTHGFFCGVCWPPRKPEALVASVAFSAGGVFTTVMKL
jgi:hypothetical protein